MVGLGGWFGWTAQFEEWELKKADEEKLRTEWLDKKRQAVNLDAYRQQLSEIDASFGVLLENKFLVNEYTTPLFAPQPV